MFHIVIVFPSGTDRRTRHERNHLDRDDLDQSRSDDEERHPLKFLFLHYLLHIFFEFLLEQNANRPICLFLFDSTNPKPAMISLLTRSPIKYFGKGDLESKSTLL